MRLDHFPSLSWNWSNSWVFLFGTLTSKKLQVCLLFCWQIEYPMNVHLIRGNHEAADINALFGFRIECIERMVCAFSLPSTHVRHRLTIFSDAMMMDIHSYTNKSWWVVPLWKIDHQMCHSWEISVSTQDPVFLTIFSCQLILCRENVMAFGYGSASISYLTGCLLLLS
jgi:hypothetical protein